MGLVVLGADSHLKLFQIDLLDYDSIVATVPMSLACSTLLPPVCLSSSRSREPILLAFAMGIKFILNYLIDQNIVLWMMQYRRYFVLMSNWQRRGFRAPLENRSQQRWRNKKAFLAPYCSKHGQHCNSNNGNKLTMFQERFFRAAILLF